MPHYANKGLTVVGPRKIGPMQVIQEQGLTNQLFAPADIALDYSRKTRLCRAISDQTWIRMGVHRVLGDVRSGREFLQQWNLQEQACVGVVQFFDSLASSRRCGLISEVNELVARAMPEHKNSRLCEYDDFRKFDVYSGDGHYIAASAHEKPVQGKKRPSGSFYAQNMRTMGVTHLSVADLEGGLKKSEHDMHALKRLGAKALRQGAKKGRKVLYAWDPAGIDIDQWGKWKNQDGIYLISRSKANMRLTEQARPDWDRDDPVNAGVKKDVRVTTECSSVPLRFIIYEDPQSGETYEFITTEMTIRPGLLAWVYKCRWDIEKTYDTFKNKLGQTKAWADSDQSKLIQARFICLAHNLMVLLEAAVGIEDEKEVRRAQKRNQQAKDQAWDRRAHFAPQYHNPRKRSQIGVKFIRWLRHCIQAKLQTTTAIQALRVVYQTY